MSEVTLQQLLAASQGGVAAIRAVVNLEPVDGQQGKIFPPTYAGGEYAWEDRRVNGNTVRAVLLDSVQSQANRLEELLLAAYRREEVRYPLIEIDFGNGLVLTSLEVPHRVHDAILRDCEIDGTRFRDSEIGKSLIQARAWNATAFYRYCPTALIFGTWDSTGGEGVHSAKVPRSLVSEIVGLDAVEGVRTGSRIDPLGIKSAIEIYGTGGSWGFEKKFGKKTRPSEINHGNVAPTISKGGVTLREAMQTTMLSLIQLRRLRFPARDGSSSDERDVAGRAVLASMGLYTVLSQWAQGYQLLSRCQLIPQAKPKLEWVGMTRDEIQPLDLDLDGARALFKSAVEHASSTGLAWEEAPVRLTPSANLRRLKEESDKLVEVADGE